MLDVSAQQHRPLDRERPIVHSPPSTPAVDLPAVVDASLGYRFAALLAYVLNPLVLPPVLLALVLVHFGARPSEVTWVTGVALVFFVAVPLGYVAWLLRRGHIASLMIRDRRRRLRPLLVGIGSCLAGTVVLYATGRTASALVAALLLGHAVNTGLILLVTLRWKVSIHLSALAGFFSALLFVLHTAWPSLAGATPLHAGPVLRPDGADSPLDVGAGPRRGAHVGAGRRGGAPGALDPVRRAVRALAAGAFRGAVGSWFDVSGFTFGSSST